MNTSVLRAVFTRNFVSYFANPTGYVFICVFVLLSSFAAFWPPEFFNSNLANLDQLSFSPTNAFKSFPFIMLVFIPAITMSIWAEERRQGTDELLLTIPAGDFVIVLGKYLAAVAIFTVALLFSLVCNYTVLRFLGNPDIGLFLATYIGYWLVGLSMLSIGMVASFLTKNLTVAFVLGVLFNAPLVFAVLAESIAVPGWIRSAVPQLDQAIKQWSIGGRFADFGHGILSLSGLTYFVMIAAVMLYLSMVLIGRRHWSRGRDSSVMSVHYLVRTVSLMVLTVTAVVFFDRFDYRPDATSEQLSSLSPKTRKLLDDLELKRPVQVEAFISPEVPESYVQARMNLLAMLRELQKLDEKGVQVRIHPTEQFSEEATRAEERFDIKPRRVVTMSRGTMAEDHIFMGVAFTCGLEKVTLPFVDRGIPAEYELVRSICTVAQQERKKIGIVQTDAQLFGQFNMQAMSSSPNWPIIDELEKMYEVERVDLSGPVGDGYDVLLAVQPSSLTQEQLTNLVAAIRAGVPTAIFEDPFPGFASNVPGTSAPRRPPGGMNPMMRQQPPPPKGDITQLWRLLGVDFSADRIIWQEHNPYPKLGHLPAELVFVDRSLAGVEPFEKPKGSMDISSKLELLLFPFPGSISKLNVSELEFDELARTGQDAGTVRYDDMLEMSFMGPRGLNPNRQREPGNMSYVLAAHITGTVPAEAPNGGGGTFGAGGHPGGDPFGGGHPGGALGEDGDPGEDGSPGTDVPGENAEEHPEGSDPQDHGDASAGDAPADDAADSDADTVADDSSEKPKEESKPKDSEINVVLVADIDMLHREFFMLREQGDNPEMGVNFNFDNVTFVLNLLDVLAGDDTFVDIRSRRPKHRTLTRVDERTEAARKETATIRDELQGEFAKTQDDLQKSLDNKMNKLREDMKNQNLDLLEIGRRIALATNDTQRRNAVEIERLKQKHDQRMKLVETKQALEIRRVQDTYKMWAIVLPPIPPLLVALAVFFSRRAREKEGVARSRLR